MDRPTLKQIQSPGFKYRELGPHPGPLPASPCRLFERDEHWALHLSAWCRDDDLDMGMIRDWKAGDGRLALYVADSILTVAWEFGSTWSFSTPFEHRFLGMDHPDARVESKRFTIRMVLATLRTGLIVGSRHFNVSTEFPNAMLEIAESIGHISMAESEFRQRSGAISESLPIDEMFAKAQFVFP